MIWTLPVGLPRPPEPVQTPGKRVEKKALERCGKRRGKRRPTARRDSYSKKNRCLRVSKLGLQQSGLETVSLFRERERPAAQSPRPRSTLKKAYWQVRSVSPADTRPANQGVMDVQLYFCEYAAKSNNPPRPLSRIKFALRARRSTACT